ncbi:MAG: hypothetical protein M5R40_23525 [Anaerolineae bacterium]|nr:hypothetical protein [Anaerolineae bacterium]
MLVLIGVPFVVAWWRDRREWGLLIPAYVLFAIAAAFVFNVFETENFVVTYVMWIIAAPFLLAAAISRQWPFLIPGGIMFVIGAAFVVGSGEAIGTAVNVFVALVLIATGAFLLYRAFIERRQPEPRPRPAVYHAGRYLISNVTTQSVRASLSARRARL